MRTIALLLLLLFPLCLSSCNKEAKDRYTLFNTLDVRVELCDGDTIVVYRENRKHSYDVADIPLVKDFQMYNRVKSYVFGLGSSSEVLMCINDRKLVVFDRGKLSIGQLPKNAVTKGTHVCDVTRNEQCLAIMIEDDDEESTHRTLKIWDNDGGSKELQFEAEYAKLLGALPDSKEIFATHYNRPNQWSKCWEIIRIIDGVKHGSVQVSAPWDPLLFCYDKWTIRNVEKVQGDFYYVWGYLCNFDAEVFLGVDAYLEYQCKPAYSPFYFESGALLRIGDNEYLTLGAWTGVGKGAQVFKLSDGALEKTREQKLDYLKSSDSVDVCIGWCERWSADRKRLLLKSLPFELWLTLENFELEKIEDKD